MPNNASKQVLRLMTYNIQVGIRTQSYGEYIRQGWRHLLPPARGGEHLLPIARIVRNHDLVAIQEADRGSYRTRTLNLMRFLAERADYPHWHLHGHRNFGKIARHGMGLLSQHAIQHVEAHALPGRISGRAAVLYRFGHTKTQLTVVVTHLSLGKRDRHRQLQRIRELVHGAEHVILMGDLNCEPEELWQQPWLREAGFQAPAQALPSHPSWQPRRQIDHILTTPSLPILTAEVQPFCWSDHLPISMEIQLPKGLALEPTP